MGVKVKFHKGAWWVFIDHHGRRRAKKIGDRETALRIAQRLRERLAAGDLQLPSIGTDEPLEAYARAWLQGLTGNLKASTIRF